MFRSLALLAVADALVVHPIPSLNSRMRPPPRTTLRTQMSAHDGILTSSIQTTGIGFESMPTSLVLSAAELSNGEVIGYFTFLVVLIAVPFVGGTMDSFRISEFREKRQDFIDAIEDEIAGLQEDGDPESLETAEVGIDRFYNLIDVFL